MSHSNSTTNYALPQFISTDKPTWLTDVNGGYSAIDAQMKLNADAASNAASAASTADGKAVQAQNDATAALNASGTNTTNITDLQTRVTAIENTQTKVKVYPGYFQTGTLAGNQDRTVDVTLPTTYKAILGVIPYGYTPSGTWSTQLVFTNTTTTGSVSFRIIGTQSQSYVLHYKVIYTVD